MYIVLIKKTRFNLKCEEWGIREDCGFLKQGHLEIDLHKRIEVVSPVGFK